MAKLSKKISAVVLAAAIATTMAITVSAEKATKIDTLKGYKTEAILCAYEDYVDGIEMWFDFSAATLYAGYGSAYVSLDVDDYYTGELIHRGERSGFETFPGGSKGVMIGSNATKSHVSLFSAHEVYSGSDGAWGVYRQLIDV